MSGDEILAMVAMTGLGFVAGLAAGTRSGRDAEPASVPESEPPMILTNPKAGWKTSEFWLTLIGKLVAAAIAGGALTVAQGEALEAQIGAVVAGIAAIVAIWRMANCYAQQRTELKLADSHPSPNTPAPTVPPTEPSAVRQAIPMSVVLLALLFLVASPATAQQPATVGPVQKTAWLPWRDRVERELRERQQQQQHQNDAALQQMIANQQRLIEALAQRQAAPPPAPAPAPQIIYLSPPLQQIPLGGAPYQQIPLGGPPRQDIPLGQAPYQQIPLGQLPYQQVPLGGPPRQQIDPGSLTLPRQQLGPPAEVKPEPRPALPLKPNVPPDAPERPPAQQIPTQGPPAGYQRFAPALYRK